MFESIGMFLVKWLWEKSAKNLWQVKETRLLLISGLMIFLGVPYILLPIYDRITVRSRYLLTLGMLELGLFLTACLGLLYLNRKRKIKNFENYKLRFGILWKRKIKRFTKYKLRFGILWDRNKQPHCNKCQKPLINHTTRIVSDGVYMFSLECVEHGVVFLQDDDCRNHTLKEIKKLL